MLDYQTLSVEDHMSSPYSIQQQRAPLMTKMSRNTVKMELDKMMLVRPSANALDYIFLSVYFRSQEQNLKRLCMVFITLFDDNYYNSNSEFPNFTTTLHHGLHIHEADADLRSRCFFCR